MIPSQLKTRCGGAILINPHTREHLVAHPEVGQYLVEAVGLITLPIDGTPVRQEVNLGRIVGRSGAIEAPMVSLDDLTTFALRQKRACFSRVALDAVGREISHLAVIAFPTNQPGVYRLATAYVGDLAPKEPWDPYIKTEAERQESIDFWATHALIYDPATMSEPIHSTWRMVMMPPRVPNPSGASI